MPKRCNVIAVVASAERARRLVLALESIEKLTSDDRIGVVVMTGGAAGDDHDEGRPVDTAGATAGMGSSIAVGGAIGAAVGGALGVGLGLVVDDIGVAAPALGGAALLGAFGALWASFARMGGSDAYRQTFVPPNARELSLVTFHTDDVTRADDAFDRLNAAADGDEVMMLDSTLSRTLRRAA